MTSIASFPGPVQLSVACSFPFFVCVQGEPGNEAKTSIIKANLLNS